jgi:hypothetical protein
MPLSRLELISSYGDQTLSRVRFVAHGTSNATASVTIGQSGMRFTQGQPVISTNLVHAHNWTQNNLGEPGNVFLMAIPLNYHVGYAVFTSAYIDRQLKRVSGAPLRYAAARKQLAFYSQPDTEAERLHIESEVANGYPLEQHPQYQLESQYVVGRFHTNSSFDALVTKLGVGVRTLEPLDYDALVRSFSELLEVSSSNNDAMASTAIRDIIVGTVESVVLSTMRNMRWQGLQLLGYSFYEGRQEAKIEATGTLADHRHRMDELGRLIASSSLLATELAWLKVYIAHELELMRMELDGAELESLPD